MSRSLRSYLLISLGCCASFIPLTAKAESQRLFFCETTNNFYPFVQTCAVPWKEVDKSTASAPATAPAPAPAPAPTQMASVLPAAEAQTTPHRVIAYPIGMPAPAQPPTPAPAAVPVSLT